MQRRFIFLPLHSLVNRRSKMTVDCNKARGRRQRPARAALERTDGDGMLVFWFTHLYRSSSHGTRNSRVDGRGRSRLNRERWAIVPACARAFAFAPHVPARSHWTKMGRIPCRGSFPITFHSHPLGTGCGMKSSHTISCPSCLPKRSEC